MKILEIISFMNPFSDVLSAIFITTLLIGLAMDNTEHLHSLVLDSSMELHLKNEFAVKVQGLDYEIMKSMIEIYEVTREIKSSNKAHFKLVPNKIGCKKNPP